MYRILITFLTLIIFSTPVFSKTQFSNLISKIENSLFGVEYTTQSDSKRLDRIEEMIYGEAKTGNIKNRLDALSKDVAANQMGNEISPKRDTFEEPPEKTIFEEKEEVADKNIEYPIVNDLEKMVFNKEYKNLNIKTRLSNLEKRSFKKTYETDDLASRVDRLKEKLAYIPSKTDTTIAQEDFDNYFAPQSSNVANHIDEYYPQSMDNYYSSKNVPQNQYNNTDDKMWENEIDNQIADRDMRSKLNKIEKNVFKQSFTQDNVNNRLSRLEGAVFNTNFTQDSNTMRLKRLESATKAQKVAKKYDSNSFSQKMTTALQIGMFVLMVVAMIL